MAAKGDGVLVLVTGASGFIATHVVQQLQEAGYRVRGTVRSTASRDKVAPLRNLCPSAKYSLELVEADLSKEEGWEDAVQGCQYVMHVASPLPAGDPKHENEVIKPAVDATLNVLRACAKAGTVKRVVLTSCCAAVDSQTTGGGDPRTEKDWNDGNVQNLGAAYYKSVAIAEKAAWDFMKDLPDDQKLELAVINPGFVFGPVLSGVLPPRLEVIKELLQREKPLVLKLNLACIDVRDVARAHVKAMTLPEAAGNRHITAHTNYWLHEISQILAEEFNSQGYKPPTITMPNFLVRIMSWYDGIAKATLPFIGKETLFNSTRMKEVLGITPIDIKTSIIDMAYSMIENGVVKKTPQYKGRT